MCTVSSFIVAVLVIYFGFLLVGDLIKIVLSIKFVLVSFISRGDVIYTGPLEEYESKSPGVLILLRRGSSSFSLLGSLTCDFRLSVNYSSIFNFKGVSSSEIIFCYVEEIKFYFYGDRFIFLNFGLV